MVYEWVVWCIDGSAKLHTAAVAPAAHKAGAGPAVTGARRQPLGAAVRAAPIDPNEAGVPAQGCTLRWAVSGELGTAL